MTYTGYDGTSALLCLATSRNLLSWTKHGVIFPDFAPAAVGKPWSKSGAILTKRHQRPVLDVLRRLRHY